MAQSEGVRRCTLALERLLNGNANNPAHVGLPIERITAGIVSVEAGFDRGYLKKGRKQHLHLIARIKACKNFSDPNGGLREKYTRVKANAEVQKREASHLKSTLDRVLTQNLMLVERVRELEKQLESNKVRTCTHSDGRCQQ